METKKCHIATGKDERGCRQGIGCNGRWQVSTKDMHLGDTQRSQAQSRAHDGNCDKEVKQCPPILRGTEILFVVVVVFVRV